MSNGVLFGTKEPEMTFLNDLMNANKQKFLEFVAALSSVCLVP